MSRKKRTTASTSTDSRPGGGTRRSDRDPDEEWDSDDFEWVETADSEGEVESESEYYFLSSSPGGRSKSGQPPSSNGSRGGDRSGDVDQILSEAYLGGDIDSDEAWISESTSAAGSGYLPYCMVTDVFSAAGDAQKGQAGREVGSGDLSLSY